MQLIEIEPYFWELYEDSEKYIPQCLYKYERSFLGENYLPMINKRFSNIRLKEKVLLMT